MKFFLEWLYTRLREQGWPKSEGLLKKRQYVTENAVVAVLQDVIRIALGLDHACQIQRRVLQSPAWT